jgi:CD63 antigen
MEFMERREIQFRFHFQIGGIALMAVGGVALKKVGDVKHVFDDGDHPGFFPAAIIALGALVFIIAFFGCCGAIRESRMSHV